MEKTQTHTISRVAGALVVSAALMPVASNAQSLADIAKTETLRRMEAVKSVDAQLLEARAAYSKKDFQKSVDILQKAINILPQGRILDDRRAALQAQYAQSSIALGRALARNGDLATARETLGGVLKADPTNAKAEAELDKLYDPIRHNPSTTKEHTSNVDKVRRHLYKGEGFYNLGLYDEAHAEFDKVLRIDPYNQASRRWQTRIHNERRDYYRSAYDETRARLLTEVDRAWEIVPTPVVDGPGRQDPVGPKLISKAVLNQRKLNSIVIPRVDFENATLESVISRLTSLARDNDSTESDPAKKGVSFVIRRRMSVGGAGDIEKNSAIRIAKLEMTNVPLGEILRQVCLQCSPQMRVKVEEFVVAIVPASDVNGTETFHRMFNVPPDFKERLIATGSGNDEESDDPFGETDSGGGAGPAKTLKETFKEMGIKFDGNSDVRFIGATSQLSVTNTAIGLDRIAKIVEDMTIQVPKMIKVTTKFVEINQQDSDELGFDWIISPFGLTGNSMFLGGGTVGNGVGRTATNFSQTVNNTPINGIGSTGNVTNTPTGGLRSGDTAITRDSINFFLNNPTRTAQTSQVAPGILSLTGLFSDGQVQMIMRGLAQKKGTDIMNAPTILARPGERARIEVVRQFIYPTEYDPPEIPDNIGGNVNGGGGGAAGAAGGVQVVPITPATPTSFEERPTGVILEIEPRLGADTEAKTISLDLEPEIVEFEGFINYGSPIQALATDALGNPTSITVTENRIEMPVFSKRTVKTGVTIYDGHTVAVGGLMSEEVQKVEDKVPVLGDIPILGRLFQSNSENRIKSNLVIFVTANIIDATGRKLYAKPGATVGSSSSSLNMVLPDLNASGR